MWYPGTLELNMRSRNYLFTQIDAYSVQQNLRQQMQAEIASFESNRLLNSNVDDLVTYFSEKNKVAVPELLEEQMVIDQKEAQRDISGDPRRRFFYGDHDGPIMVTGVEIAMSPYPANAGCATAAGSRRTRLAPPSRVPVLS